MNKVEVVSPKSGVHGLIRTGFKREIVVETIEHRGQQVRKVDRKSKTGDFARFNGLPEGLQTKNGQLYEVVNNHWYDVGEGPLVDVYGWPLHCPDPEIFEVVNPLAECPSQVESEIVARLVDVTALRETIEILSQANMKTGPFVLRELLPNGDIKEIPTTREKFLDHYIGWATELILEMLDDYFDEDGELLVTT